MPSWNAGLPRKTTSGYEDAHSNSGSRVGLTCVAHTLATDSDIAGFAILGDSNRTRAGIDWTGDAATWLWKSPPMRQVHHIGLVQTGKDALP